MSQRLKRLADQIQRTLSVLIRDEINDPRLTGFVTISAVKVSPDLGYADIYVTILNGNVSDDDLNKESHAESLEILNNASGFLRSELSRTMKTRTTPRLRFHYDEVVANGNRLTNLVNQAMQKTAQSELLYDEPTQQPTESQA